MPSSNGDQAFGASAYSEAERRIAFAEDTKQSVINLSIPGLTRIPSLKNVSNAKSIILSGTRISDVMALSELPELQTLDISRTRVANLRPISRLLGLATLNASETQVYELNSISDLPNLEALDIHGSPVVNFIDLSKFKALRVLNLKNTKIFDLTSVSQLRRLRSLNLANTQISNLQSLIELKNLEFLDISGTKVTNISVLSDLTSLVEGANNEPAKGGLSFARCLLSKELNSLSKLSNPGRTLRTINYLREQKGQPRYEATSPEDFHIERPSDERATPLPDVPSPFDFELSKGGTITATLSPTNVPKLTRALSEKDHQQRIDACKTVAGDIIESLNQGLYQARQEYLFYLKKYVSRLPDASGASGAGNILLADAAARFLRNLFSAEHDQLSIAFASVLKVFLEQHTGLRAYYPEIATFYSDVRDGKLASPLPLDAVDAFVQGVIQHTPEVFAPNVAEAIEETDDDLSDASRSHVESTTVDDHPLPPPDPLGELDVQRAQEFSVASTINRLWKAFLEGEKVHRAAKAWISAAHTLGPYAIAIIEWLRNFLFGPHSG